MNILILGSGGREHAMAKKISESPDCVRLFIAPGNAGTEQCGTNVPLSISDFDAIADFVLQQAIDMVVVGPEDPLVNGIVDFFKSTNSLKNVLIVGPSKRGAALEGSKDVAKEFMMRHAIPTAKYKTFSQEDKEQAVDYLERLSPPYVIKADGLAAGKGVIITSSKEEAKNTINEIFIQRKFGSAGEKIVIEEFLDGIELSVFVLTDGETYKVLPEAKDYKRIGEKDTGPNTGGMGAVSPVPFADSTFMKKVEERIIRPTVEGLKAEQIYYRGFIFIGLMNVAGDPYVIEYNVRMGDPETEVVFPRIDSDVVELLKNTVEGNLQKSILKISQDFAVTVVVASGGYPGTFEKEKSITINKLNKESQVFHAGTITSNGKMLTNGGRVFAVTSKGKSINDAKEKSYRQIKEISFDKMYYRNDIGIDLMKQY